ncbi:MAG: type II secretion system major pseudopilin GspG [Phycisphaerales bacterium]|nr:type II secretion system major pseudopilin GspG [Phycisphaerales bacterium]
MATATVGRISRRHPARGRSGFTLLEMLLVVVIIGMLAALVFTNLGRVGSESKVKITRTQIEALATMVERFKLDVGRYPTKEEGLKALVEKPAGVEGWNGPYGGKKTLPKDGWGRDFVYDTDATFGFVIRSLGADSKPGGEGENADLDNRQ